MSTLIAIDKIHEPINPLRIPDIHSEKYQSMRESIKARGIDHAITVARDVVNGQWSGQFLIIDGMHRYYIALDLGLEALECTIQEDKLDPIDRLELSIEMNEHRIATKPHDWARAMARILDAHPDRTKEEQRKRLSISAPRLNQLLKISKLEGPAAQACNDGEISLLSATHLARYVSKTKQQIPQDLLDKAKRVPAYQIEEEVDRRIKAFKKEKPAVKARLRRLTDVKAEFERAKKACDKPTGWVQALEWVLQLDEISLQARKPKK